MRSLFVLVSVLWIAACSAFVNPGSDEVRCVARSGASDPCGELGPGLVCREGKCLECVAGAVQEDCNRIDDDCDGRIDEGNDQDGDGFTWCGGGIRALADCVDTDPTVHPPGDTLDDAPPHRDICGDGIDNDCSSVPDDDPTCDVTANCEDSDTPCTTGGCITCPSGQLCEPCAQGRNCGERLSICVAPQGPGSTCSVDSDCQPGICVDAEAVGAPSSLGKVCSSACCTDADCGGDNICLVRGNGTRLCVPPGLVGRVSKRQEEACGEAGECSSGACDAPLSGGDTSCRRLCVDDGDCAGSPHGDRCMYQTTLGFLTPVGFACGPPIEGATAQTGQFCTPSSNGCESGLCAPSLIYISACNESCRRDCDLAGSTCAYQSIAEFIPGQTPRLPLCTPTNGTSALGGSCESGNACSEGDCINGTCRSACCNDSDCFGERCRPVSASGGYGMYCVP